MTTSDESEEPASATERGYRTLEELPQEDAWGNEIEYVWVVYRPVKNSNLGRAELLSAFDNPEAAEKHRKAASSKHGDCEIQAMRVSDGTHPLQEAETNG